MWHPEREAVTRCDYPESGPRAHTCSTPLCADCARPWCVHLAAPADAKRPLDLCPGHSAFARRYAPGGDAAVCGCPGHHGGPPAAPIPPRSCPAHHVADCAWLAGDTWRCRFEEDTPPRLLSANVYDPVRCNIDDPTKCPKRGWRGPCLFDADHGGRCSFESEPPPATPPQAEEPVGRTRCFQRRPRAAAPREQLALFGAPAKGGR